MSHVVTSLSLVSGIGGIELGLRLAIPGLRVLGYVEREAFAASVLLARMEDEILEPAPVFCGNLEDFDASEFAGVDLVTAGLPCQPFSVAGQQRGHDDERAIWPEFVRIVSECRPALVFLENVPTFVTGGWFRRPGEELSRLGYEIAPPLFLAASDVGASHIRERVFILAYRSGIQISRFSCAGPSEARHCGEELALSLANAISERGQQESRCASCDESQDERRQHDNQPECNEQIVGDTEQHDGRQGQGESIAVQPPCAWPPSPSDWERWAKVPQALEPAFCRMADGLPHSLEPHGNTTERLRALGNAVVPIVSAIAFRILIEEAQCMSS
jgi:DNA (cytosine-5)-methyltransferase 1